MSKTDPSNERQVATLAGGCFWCLEAVFQQLRGVDRVQSGYTGGHVPHPSYEQVCTGATGHAEAVQISFDPQAISYTELLEVFFTLHDPTTPNRQGPDVGTQYRSAIFHHTDEQRTAAERVIAEVQRAGVWSDPLVTEVAPLDVFYPAEEYHRDYYQRNPNQGYCQVIIAPKVAKLRQHFLEKLERT
jgi:peptide-methionine (S)-S-oxide reductase